MKKITLVLATVLVSKLSFGKAMDEAAAKKAGYNFLKTEGVQADLSAMTLMHKATAVVKNAEVTDFYIFSLGANGFVIVSGDDNITPVLGFSGDDMFRMDNMPAGVQNWFNTYQAQINRVIEHGTVNEKAVAEWNSLLNEAQHRSGAKATVVAPFMTTKWDQAGYYNKLCPFDATADTNALTGCVATAMSQVMRYWKWPLTGVSSHSYYSKYGTLSANFAATTYAWDSMPNTVTKANNFVAGLMSQAGISVNMSYSPTSSGAYVTESSSPITNCAEYALKTYFRYKTSMSGISRYSYDDSTWIKMIRTDLDLRRPVIYTGDGNDGGHCFIADGYTTGDKIHINWGWGSYYNGYYVFTNLDPGTSTFDNYQTVILGLEPDNPATLSVTAVAENKATIYPNPATEMLNISLPGGEKADNIAISDMQGRIIITMVPSVAGVVTIPVAGFSAGIYIVSIRTGSGTETKKVVIE